MLACFHIFRNIFTFILWKSAENYVRAFARRSRCFRSHASGWPARHTLRERPGYIKLTQPADLRNLTELGAGVHPTHFNHEACNRHSDDSYDNGSLGWRGTALVGPQSLQEGSCSPHIRSRSCPGAAGRLDRGSYAVNDLHVHLCRMRNGLIAKMIAHLEIGGDVAGWLPLLSQTQAAIETVEAAMRESLTP